MKLLDPEARRYRNIQIIIIIKCYFPVRWISLLVKTPEGTCRSNSHPAEAMRKMSEILRSTLLEHCLKGAQHGQYTQVCPTFSEGQAKDRREGVGVGQASSAVVVLVGPTMWRRLPANWNDRLTG